VYNLVERRIGAHRPTTSLTVLLSDPQGTTKIDPTPGGVKALAEVPPPQGLKAKLLYCNDLWASFGSGVSAITGDSMTRRNRRIGGPEVLGGGDIRAPIGQKSGWIPLRKRLFFDVDNYVAMIAACTRKDGRLGCGCAEIHRARER
jgi:hypothetical protein